MKLELFAKILCCFLSGLARSLPLTPCEGNTCLEPQTPTDVDEEPLKIRATTAHTAANIMQSINNWIQDVDTVNSFLDDALGLGLGSKLQSRASQALSFAQNEPTNNQFLGATPGLDSKGLAAAKELDDVFGDVLVQLGNMVNDPRDLNVALKAVNRININRCQNVLPSAETLWRSAATAMNIATTTWPPRANRERICPGPQNPNQ